MSVNYVYPFDNGQNEGLAPNVYSISCSNTKAEVVASGFFNQNTEIKKDVMLIVRCTDGLTILDVTSLTPTTVATIY